jgi:phosphoglycolate phosphatase
MQKKIVLFDFDGTIANTLTCVVEIFNRVAPKYNLPQIDPDKLHSLRGKTPTELIKEYNIPLIKIPFLVQDIRSQLKKEIGSVTVFPGMKEVLSHLKKNGYRMGIISSNSAGNVKAFLDNNRITEIDFIHNELNIFGKDKALKNVLRKYSFQPADTIYVGDEVRDIEACKKAGVDVISVTYGFNTKESLMKHDPTFLVDTPEELLKVLI